MDEMTEMEKQIAELAQNYADADARIEELEKELAQAEDRAWEQDVKYEKLEMENDALVEQVENLAQLESLMEVFAHPNNWDGNKFTPQETKWQIEEPYRLATRALEENL